MFGSVSGWLTEFVSRSVRAKKLINPGFLSGPALPIYGFGTVILFALSEIDLSFISNPILRGLFVFGASAAVMTLLELVAGLVFIKGMRIKLWDYSNLKFNFKGIICPQFSLLWGVVGAAFYFLAHPVLKILLGFVEGNLWTALCVGAFYGIFFVDFAFSMRITQKLKKVSLILKRSINFEKFKDKLRTKVVALHKKYIFILPFKVNENIDKLIEALFKEDKAKDEKEDK